jgi:hypothetical protein
VLGLDSVKVANRNIIQKAVLGEIGSIAVSYSPDDEYGKWDKPGLAVEIMVQI